MYVHWQGFDLTPRDFIVTNPLAPSARASISGHPLTGAFLDRRLRSVAAFAGKVRSA